MRRAGARLTAWLITAMAWIVTGVTANWKGCTPSMTARVYYANHASHGDFVLIWSVLPGSVRRRTRPVAGADYWQKAGLRRYIGTSVFNAVLIDRDPGSGPGSGRSDPIATMAEALEAGSSLILFPEGTRNLTTETLLPFKSGVFHLARRCPTIEFVPVWIEHLNRVLPKGEFVPVPLLCTVTFGAPIVLAADDDKSSFLKRTRDALLALGSRETERHR